MTTTVSAKHVRAFTADELTNYVSTFPGFPAYAIDHPNLTQHANTVIVDRLVSRYATKPTAMLRPTAWYEPDINTIAVILNPTSHHHRLLTPRQRTALHAAFGRIAFAVRTRLLNRDGYRSDTRALSDAQARLGSLATTQPDLFTPEDASRLIVDAAVT